MIVTSIPEKKVFVRHKNKEYQTNNDLTQNVSHDYNSLRVKVSSAGEEIFTALVVRESESNISLIEKRYSFLGIDEFGNLTMDLDESKRIVFNKELKKIESDSININHGYNMTEERMYSARAFALSCLYHSNPDLLSELVKLKIDQRHAENETTIINLLNLCTENVLGLEKLIKSGKKRFIEENIMNENFEISSEGKLHRMVDLPKFVLKFISDNKIESTYDSFKVLSDIVNGNDLKIYLQFIEDMSFVITNMNGESKDSQVSQFTELLIPLIRDHGYKITPLITYLTKVSFYNAKSKAFQFPVDEITMLKDYVDMCTAYNFQFDKYESDLEKAHDTVMKNISILNMSTSKNQKFEKAVESYKKYEHSNGVFTIITPKSVQDLVREGNMLHHCVGGYVDRVSSGKSKIFFLRDAENPDKPFVTVELDKNNKAVQYKGRNNSKPSDVVVGFIKRWEKSNWRK